MLVSVVSRRSLARWCNCGQACAKGDDATEQDSVEMPYSGRDGEIEVISRRLRRLSVPQQDQLQQIFAEADPSLGLPPNALDSTVQLVAVLLPAPPLTSPVITDSHSAGAERTTLPTSWCSAAPAIPARGIGGRIARRIAPLGSLPAPHVREIECLL